jgi:mono/diheme cytochrome c family protein
MKAAVIITALLCVVFNAYAEPFQGVDHGAGKKLALEQNCARCHIEQFGGDGSKIYSRPDRRVNNVKQLQTQVTFCSTRLKAGWFPEDEEQVAAYLNKEYYKFK